MMFGHPIVHSLESHFPVYYITHRLHMSLSSLKGTHQPRAGGNTTADNGLGEWMWRLSFGQWMYLVDGQFDYDT